MSRPSALRGKPLADGDCVAGPIPSCLGDEVLRDEHGYLCAGCGPISTEVFRLALVAALHPQTAVGQPRRGPGTCHQMDVAVCALRMRNAKMTGASCKGLGTGTDRDLPGSAS